MAVRTRLPVSSAGGTIRPGVATRLQHGDGAAVKDDLVEGRQALRLDDLERWEMMVVQLDEARGFLARGTVTHARLAFILLDNAAEVIMRRNLEREMTHNRRLEQIRDAWKEIVAESPDDAEAKGRLHEVQSEVVSKRARKALADGFDPKVDFIRDRDGIPETEARVLKKLHRYRNELYHRDHMRPETILSACLLYFDLTCTLFERLPQAQFSVATLHMQAPPELRKFCPDETDGYPAVEQVTAGLRCGLGIDDAGLMEALAGHLSARLDDLDAAVSRVQGLLFGDLPEHAPSVPWRQLVIHLAQWDGEKLPESFDELLAAQVQYRESDLAVWRQLVTDVRDAVGRLALFAVFADAEDAFEPFEERMMALDLRLELEIQRDVDMRRGK
jgi:hypothetical protein